MDSKECFMKANVTRRGDQVILPAMLKTACAGVAQAKLSHGQRLASPAFSVSQTATQSSTAPVDKEVVIFGTKIHYVEAGSGPVVILLHGLGGSTQNWALNVSVLAQKFRVIVPDQ